MKSPIGLYLAEFRSGPAPALVPEELDLAPIAFAVGEPALAFPDAVLTALSPAPEMADDRPDPLPAEPQPDLSEIVAALQADHAAALADARRQWAADEGEALARSLSGALAALEERFAETLAPLLEPFLVRAAQLRAIDELRDALRTLLSGDGQGIVTVAGPADLLAALEAAHPGEPRLAFVAADVPDVTVTLADTTVRSRLQAWASTLEASLGELS